MAAVLEDRVARLEKSNRRLKWALAACSVLVAGILAGADRAPGPMVASESIRLIDRDGKLRMQLGCDDQGTFLFLNDESGKMRTSLAAQKGQTYVNLKDDQDRTRCEVRFDDVGPALMLRDEAGAIVGALAYDTQGPYLQIRDTTGKIRILTTVSDVTSEPKKEEQK